MKLLVIGGTVFLGRHIVQFASEQGHEVVLFNRGKTNPDLFPELRKSHGDRFEGFGELVGEQFDAIVDTCAFFPRAVRGAAEAFAGSNATYALISSISVFAQMNQPCMDEDSPVATIEDETTEDIGGGAYGPLKALCEKEAGSLFGERALIIRPGLIVGPHDPTDRFTYWPKRFAEYSSVLAPNVPDQPVQIIDVRDLAAFIVRALESGRTGIYNATGPVQPLSLTGFLETIRSRIRPEARIVWVDSKELEKDEVQPWSDLPCVLDYDGSSHGMLKVDVSKAVRDGLTFRSLEETAADTLEWSQSLDRPMKCGLSREREQRLMALNFTPQ